MYQIITSVLAATLFFIVDASAQTIESKPNTRQTGEIFKSFPPGNAHPVRCLRACRRDAQCTAYTYVPPDSQNANGMCHLIKGESTYVNDSCCTSGQRSEPDPNRSVIVVGSRGSEGAGESRADKRRNERRKMQHCVRDVETTFKDDRFAFRLKKNRKYKRGPSGKFRANMLHGAKLPPDGHVSRGPKSELDHIQGLARIETETGAWMVFTRSTKGLAKSKHGAFFVVRLGQVPANHKKGRFVGWLNGDYFPPEIYRGGKFGGSNFAAFMKNYPDSDHPGGIQAVGAIVAIPFSCNADSCKDRGPWVEFWDFADPMNPRLLQKKYLDDELRDEAGSIVNKAGKASFVRDADGSYLLLVSREDGRASVFRTSGSENFSSETGWRKKLPDFRFDSDENWNTANDPQGISLIRECGSDKLYLAGFKPENYGIVGIDGILGWTGGNELQLFRIGGSFDNGNARMEFVYENKFGNYNEYCQFRGGASIYVTPSNEPILYCSAGWAKRPDDGTSKATKFWADAVACGVLLCLSEITDVGALAKGKIHQGIDYSAAKLTGKDALILRISEFTYAGDPNTNIRDHRDPKRTVESKETPISGIPGAKRITTECSIEGNNRGCNTRMACPAGSRIRALKAACNLEFGKVDQATFDRVPLNTMKVIRASDKVSHGACSVGRATISEGSRSLMPELGQRAVRISCKERDKNGGDCHIMAEISCAD